ncbi:acyl-CoA dehydratase activase [Acetivibrio cellulolyticus]|uniref:acyl-CoA dehydratase activase n=1 Tax=Acetivibrio cellulolyticus TaxID=35830 RepID=UPI0001E2EC46|nr:acyl-CoA dehydratase activase [Acetivibrio cellulolyticus]
MRILGIDLGSRAVKLAVFDGNEFVIGKVFDTASFYRDYCENRNQKIGINLEKLDIGEIHKIISTGYGRNNVNVSDAEVITELKAHTYGAVWQTGLKNFTLLDIGGQDSKVISVRNGRMADMVLNDKCAASCGRYLENMATIIGISIDEMKKYYNEPVELSSTCAVFGESELIGRISEGYTADKLASGVNYSLYKRIKPMIARFPADYLVLSGGVANNEALIHFIKQDLGWGEIVVPGKPQLNGSIGCCAYYFDKMN